MAKATARQGNACKTATTGLHSTTIWVEPKAILRVGQTMTLDVLDQKPWFHLANVRSP
jgi:hypothetical protein